MCTKYFSDGDVHKYFNPYNSPYDSYINFMNVLNNLHNRCFRQTPLDTDNVADKTLPGKNYLTGQVMGGAFCPTPKRNAAKCFSGVGSQNESETDLQMVD